MESRHPAEYIRIVLYTGLLFTCLVGGLTTSAFWLAIGVTAVSLLLYLWQWPPFFRLVMAWEAAFVFLVCREGIGAASEIAVQVGQYEYGVAARFMVGAYAASMLGHRLVFKETRHELTDWFRAMVLDGKQKWMPATLVAFVYLVFLVQKLPWALSMAGQGRLGLSDGSVGPGSVFGTILSGLSTSAGLVLPAMIAYVVTYLYQKKPYVAVLWSLPVFTIYLMIGTRFPLLFSVMGLTIVLLAPHRLSFKVISRLVMVGVLLLSLSTMMAATRNVGLEHAGGEVVERYVEQKGLAHYEGVVLSTARLVDYFDHQEHMHGRSSAVLLLFWVPRAIWPNKPTFLGHWFPRAYLGTRGFAGGHSISFTFSGDAYVDFGFYGGIIFWIFGGMLFGWIERWNARVVAKRGSPQIVICATLYGGTVFAVRSLNTSIIVLSGVFLIGLLFVLSVPLIPRASIRKSSRSAPRDTGTTSLVNASNTDSRS